MPFDPTNLNPSTRFYWGDSTDEWVDLRIVPENEFRRIRREVGIKSRAEYVPHPQTRQMQRVEYQDIGDEQITALDAAVNDYCISAWNLMTPDGDAIPCTRENKLRFIEGSPVFSRWVAKCMEQLREDSLKVGESEQKN